MRIGCFGMIILLLVVSIVVGIVRENTPNDKICTVTYSDNTVATYECRYVDVKDGFIVVGTEDGKVNIPMSCVKMFTTKQ